MCALIVACLLYWAIPTTLSETEKAMVSIVQESYYRLDSDGKPVLFFADYEDGKFYNGSNRADSIIKNVAFLQGYWTNLLPFLPSSFGHIVAPRTLKPARIVAMRGQKELHELLFRLFIQVDTELGNLQTQKNELAYYLRIHSVQDYGYNQIADYQEQILHKMDSLERLEATIHAIKKTAKLRIYQMNSYRTIGKKGSESLFCQRTKVDDANGTITLRTASGITPLGIFTRISKANATRLIAKSRKPEKKNVPFVPQNANYRNAEGYYLGETKQGKPHGYGQFYGFDGSFYSGHYADGKRNGYGFMIAPHAYLLAGDWKNDVYKGERLTYTADRVYGIDLSKHQHERNNKVYQIAWNKLRITHLGTLSNKTIKGKVDYPVSFIYIKSTEGTTVLNKYYAADYREARNHGFRVGTYHFFSTTSAGIRQADYFLANSLYKEGDLPLVLDVEPSDEQIAKMGGAEKMFKEVRAWLNHVYAKTGKRPILYISQMFANNYMPLAPDLGDNYLVWIARYGQYKPNIKLAYWQLSPDGKVRGINGDVDINVFNGYRNQYANFVKRHAK